MSIAENGMAREGAMQVLACRFPRVANGSHLGTLSPYDLAFIVYILANERIFFGLQHTWFAADVFFGKAVVTAVVYSSRPEWGISIMYDNGILITENGDERSWKMQVNYQTDTCTRVDHLAREENLRELDPLKLSEVRRLRKAEITNAPDVTFYHDDKTVVVRDPDTAKVRSCCADIGVTDPVLAQEFRGLGDVFAQLTKWQEIVGADPVISPEDL